MSRRLEILVDVDGVLVDFVGKLLDMLKAEGAIAEAIRVEDVTQWDISQCLGIDWRTINAIVHRSGFVEKLPVYLGAGAFLSELRALVNVTAVTSPYTGAPHWIGERIDYLVERLGFEPNQICVWSQKERVAGDVLIDDAAHNAKAFATTGRPVALINRPWNVGAVKRPGVRRCDYSGALDVVRRLADAGGFS
jgi:5'(3')-deoxyribonucleotidase